MSFYCRMPWENLVLNRTCYAPCCYTLKAEPYRFTEKKTNDLMDSEYMKDYRRSILLGTYLYCAPFCPRLPTYSKNQINENEGPSGLRVLSLNYDENCNLTCPSCRDHQKNNEENLFHEGLFSYFSTHEKFEELYLSGSGEALVSSSHRNWLMNFSHEQYPHLKTLALASNGQLLDKKTWEQFPEDLKKLDLVFIISVDAASEETYKKIRRGGDFSRLIKNLDFLSRLLKDNQIKALYCNFIIQKNNYKEIPEFLQLTQKRWKASNVSFVEILPWVGSEKGYFEEQAVWKKDHSEHKEYLKVIANPHLYGFEYQGIHRDIWGRGVQGEFKQVPALSSGLNLFKLSVLTPHLSLSHREYLKKLYPLLDYDDLSSSYQLTLFPSFIDQGMNLFQVLSSNEHYWAKETYDPKVGYNLLQNFPHKDPVRGVWFSSLKELEELTSDSFHLNLEQEDKAQFTFLINEKNFGELMDVVRLASLKMKLRSLHVYESKPIPTNDYLQLIQSPFLLGVHYYGPYQELWGNAPRFVDCGQRPSFYFSLFKLIVEDEHLTHEQKILLRNDYPQIILSSSLDYGKDEDALKYKIRLSSSFFESADKYSLWAILFEFASQTGKFDKKTCHPLYEIGEVH